MKKTTLLCLVSLFLVNGLRSQNCAVSVDSLNGQYSGDCKKGKADGVGTAKGVDSYSGEFRNGYPDGHGKYIWRNGSWYEGFWKNGLFDGKGTLSKLIGLDSMVVMNGFWKKGKYIGQYEKPYVVNSITNNISDINVRKLNNLDPEITIQVKNITGGGSSLGYPLLPKSRLTDIQIIQGRFEQQVNDETGSPVSNKYILRKVTYPFYAILSFETTGTNAKLHVEKVSVDIFENSNWYIQVNVDN